MSSEIIIRGGATDATAAAITAVILAVLEEEARALATPPSRLVPSAWVLSGRPVTVIGPSVPGVGPVHPADG